MVIAMDVGYNRSMTDPTYRSVLITGASSGIGAAVALELAKPGVLIAMTGRNAERLQETDNACRNKGAETMTGTIDVTDRAAMSAFITDIEARHPLDLVFANAGISSSAGAGDGDDEKTRDVFAINLAGVLNTVLPALTAMRARHAGQIAIVSSIAGFRGMPTAPAYSASKVALSAWGEAIRPQLTRGGISLSMIYPGFVESRITDANDFPMPFIMPAEKAAAIIVAGLARRKKSIAFPWPMVWMMRLLTLLPRPLYNAVLARAPKKTT
jgi:short-subunit dehydrogenase